MCSEEFKNSLKQINLKEFAEKYYNVKWKGNKAICCFYGHKEKTPSMCYIENTNTIYCQGCKEGGDIFKFIALVENLDNNKDFVDIMKIICDLEGINYPTNNKPVNHEMERLLNEKTNFAMEFKKELWANKSGGAFNYLLDRGLTDETINIFHLGATKTQHETRYCSKISDKIKDLSNRVSIPILSRNGKKVVAMSFRDLGDSKSYKYLHDKTDKVFNKSEIFYGYSHALNHIKKEKHCYIVEGYFDMISMYQAGMKNTLACMTSEMSYEQLDTLSKITENVTIILDQDSAGAKGFNRTLALILNMGLNVRVVPSLNYLGKDINELCNELDWKTDEIKAVINSNSKDGVFYYLSFALDKFDDNFLTARESVMNYSANILNCITDPIKRKNYESYVNRRLMLE